MKENEINTTAKVVTLIAACVIILGTYFFLTTPSTDKKKYSESEPENFVSIGGEFTLTNMNNEKENTVKFNKQYKLVYFGFTYCPDICPMALGLISQIIDITNKYGIDIVPIFVTIDPQRDTPDVLGPYLNHFNKKIIGYTGSEEEIKQVADLFKVFYAKAPRNDAPENEYLMDHSSIIYFLSPDSKFIKNFSSSSKPEEVANFIHNTVKSVR